MQPKPGFRHRHGHEAWFESDRELVDWVVGLNADTLFYDLDDDRTRAEIGRWIRTRDRILDALERRSRRVGPPADGDRSLPHRQ